MSRPGSQQPSGRSNVALLSILPDGVVELRGARSSLSNRAPFQHPETPGPKSLSPESPGLESQPLIVFRQVDQLREMQARSAIFERIKIASIDTQDGISEQPTDAFREIEFIGSRGRRSNFLRLSCDSDPKEAYKLITGLWKLPSPNLVVSVVEGEGREEIKPWVRDFLRNVLVRAAQSTGAWILTDGLRRGVARCVGEAVRDYKVVAPALSQKVMVVGVAPWGMVHNRERLVNPQGSYPAQYFATKTSRDSFCLDNNHQAFLLVDDERGGSWGGERSFRTNLEHHISLQRTDIQEIPVVCMLISGDSSMLERVDSSLRKKIPWLVLAGSGPAANFITELKTDISSDPYLYSRAVDLGLRDRVSEKLKRHFPFEHVDRLVGSALSICKHRDLITVFHGELDGSEDFQSGLLSFLIEVKKLWFGETSDYTVALKQAMAWNNVDIARSELLNDDIQWKTADLEDLMTDALIKDNLEFVRLFCENGLNIQEYLTYGRLEDLYSSLSKSLPAYKRPSKHKRRAGLTSETTQQRSQDKVTLSEVSRLLSHLTGDVCQPFYNHQGQDHNTGARETCKKENSEKNDSCPSPWSDLFIWAVLQNRAEMAKYFWERSLLSQIWWGDMDKDTEVWRLLLTFFIPPLIYTDLISFRKEEELISKGDVKDSDVMKESDKTRIPLSTISKKNPEECEALNKNVEDPSPPKSKQSFLVSRWKQFWFAPVTSFLSNVLMYFLFLCLFAYILLVDFKPPPPKGPSISEYVLYFWVFTFMCEEIRQMFWEGGKSTTRKIKIYIMDDWNKIDLTAIFLFLLALCCRMFSWSYKVGRAMMALDFVVFTVRLLHIFSIHRVLGPKIVMVRRMMKDLFFFLFFLAVWLIAYGVANKALLYSYDPSPIRILNQVFYQPYMYIFGQFPDINMDAGVQEEGKCTTNATLIEAGHEPCPNTYANWLVIILYIIYLLFTNIVLVNLLIAMFSYTFTVVQERSDIHWKYLRYNLIMEYYSRPYLAPPFIIISHLHLFIKRFIRDIPSSHRQYPALDLEKKKASRLYRWEANQKENLLSPQNKKQRESDSAQLRSTSVRVDSMLKQMAEIRDQNRRLKSELAELAQRSSFCCDALSRITEALCQTGCMPPQTNSTQNLSRQ
ncbi:transient receptor potential cation channel subfamily M member 4-like isoform X2 [Cheilinus undulatus]|nr:transient receptor potential cation channel subfamily M member 4-like isoform X2 [Cheilinus undulatus]